MTNRQNQPSPFVDECGAPVDVTLTFPVLRFPRWRIAVWTVHDSGQQDTALGLSFYSLNPCAGRVPRRIYRVEHLFRERDNPLMPLWRRYPGMRLAAGLQLLMFHELPPRLEQPLKRFTLQELEARNPHIAGRLAKTVLPER